MQSDENNQENFDLQWVNVPRPAGFGSGRPCRIDVMGYSLVINMDKGACRYDTLHGGWFRCRDAPKLSTIDFTLSCFPSQDRRYRNLWPNDVYSTYQDLSISLNLSYSPLITFGDDRKNNRGSMYPAYPCEISHLMSFIADKSIICVDGCVVNQPFSEPVLTAVAYQGQCCLSKQDQSCKNHITFYYCHRVIFYADSDRVSEKAIAYCKKLKDDGKSVLMIQFSPECDNHTVLRTNPEAFASYYRNNLFFFRHNIF